MEDRLEKFKKDPFAFLKKKIEDIYKESDGKPIPEPELELKQKIEFSFQGDKLVIRVWRPIK